MSQKYSFNPDPFGVHYKIIQAVPVDSSVLDIGCASGYIAEELQKKGCTVDAVEINKEDALQAKKFCRQLIIDNLEDGNNIKEL